MYQIATFGVFDDTIKASEFQEKNSQIVDDNRHSG